MNRTKMHNMLGLLLGAFLCAVLFSCSTDRGYVSVDAIAPSVDAVTTKFDELVIEAVGDGRMAPQEGDTWLGESALLRHVATAKEGEPIAAPELLTPQPDAGSAGTGTGLPAEPDERDPALDPNEQPR